MTATQAEAVDDILTVVDDAWTTTGYTMLWPASPGAPPATMTPWARSTVRHEDSPTETLADVNGRKRYTRQGTLFVQIFVPVGSGLSVAYNLAKIITDACEGTKTPRGVWFSRARSREVGPDGNFYQLNVLVDFEYDEMK